LASSNRGLPSPEIHKIKCPTDTNDFNEYSVGEYLFQTYQGAEEDLGQGDDGDS